MKLLLTSSGIDNRSIAAALNELTGKAPGQNKIGFVSTAINAEEGNKDWAINQFLNSWRYGYNWIDIVDPSADNVDWQERLDVCDVIYISGGNTFHLLDQTRKTGFDKWLEANKNDKVIIGSSAGTLLLTPTIAVAGLEPGPDINLCGIEDLTGINWVDFEVEPHCDESRFAIVEQYAKKLNHQIYAIDDQTAIKVDGDKITVVSEGFWKLFNK